MIFKGFKNYNKLLYNPKKFFSWHVVPQRFAEIKNHTPLTQYANLNPVQTVHKLNTTRIITDNDTGLRFLIQEGGFPGCSDLGVCIKLGTQNQQPANAGSLQYLKNYVHMKKTFEQIVQNYQILAQTGSSFDLNYDVQTTYVKGSFFYQDVDLMTDLLLDLAIQEKNMFQDNFQTSIDLTNINQLVRRTAFKGKGIGMPSNGLGNILTNREFLAFQQKIAPKNTIISMSNMRNPENVIKMIKQKIQKKYSKFLKRTPPPPVHSEYFGGLQKFQSNNQFFDFAVAFPSVSFSSEHMEMMNILRILLGSASSFSSGGPGKGMHSRCTKNLLNQVSCVQKCSFINQHYDQTGLFGLTVGGPHQQAKDVVECTLQEFKRLKHQIPKEQLQRSKNILISSVYSNIQKQSDRLQQMTKHIFSYGRIRLYEYQNKIRAVTSQDIQKFMKQMFLKNPTFVFSGNQQSLKVNYTEKDLKKILDIL